MNKDYKLAKIAYEAYAKEYCTDDGMINFFPPFDSLPDKMKNCLYAASVAVEIALTQTK